MTPHERLTALYAEIAQHTWSDCVESCTMQPRFSCCHPIFCRLTVLYASRAWGVRLEDTDHPSLPLMGPDGCVAAPHLRPTCSKHTCERSPLPFKGQHRPSAWHVRYEELLAEIEALEESLDLDDR